MVKKPAALSKCLTSTGIYETIKSCSLDVVSLIGASSQPPGLRPSPLPYRVRDRFTKGGTKGGFTLLLVLSACPDCRDTNKIFILFSPLSPEFPFPLFLNVNLLPMLQVILESFPIDSQELRQFASL